MRRPSVQLALVSLAVFLGLSLWFSASAVGPEIQKSWGLSSGQLAWLTIAVQLGFVVGTLVSAILNLPDRMAPQWLMAICACGGALANLAIALGCSDTFGRTEQGFYAVVALRLVIGASMAGIYPPGMKLVASWFKARRGIAIGIVVGALTVGSASPHLLLALPLDMWFEQGAGFVPIWRLELMVVSGAALCSAMIALWGIRPGPVLPQATQFDWRYFYKMWRDEPLKRANYGYLGHQWELYAMWTWVPMMVVGSFESAGWGVAAARWCSFFIIAVGGLGCIVGGVLSDSFGRTRTTIVSLVVSGSCCLFAGFLFSYPFLLVGVCLVWGFAVIADSAQFSTAISELSKPDLVGTALTVQTCVGFLLTVATIRLVPALEKPWGWGIALSILALGPLFGIWHMARLRRMPEAVRMAVGKR